MLGDPGRLWIVAGEQTQGRGRHGRSWRSPPGNLYASALVVDPCEAAIAPQIGFVAGVALVKAVEDLGGAGVALKWPNDLLWNGAKLAGLLVEGVSAPGAGARLRRRRRRQLLLLAAGARLPDHRSSRRAATRRLAGGAVPPARGSLSRGDRPMVARRGLRRNPRALARRSAAGLGGPIRVAGAQGSREGVFEGLDADGRLLMRTAGALETVEAADIFLAPPADGAGGGPPPRAEILDESLDR